MELTTLCYIESGGAYLLLHRTKKKQDVNAGKWIGIGGHFLEGESPEECVLREIQEETGLRPEGLCFRGLITFVNEAGTEYMCLFTADAGDMLERATADAGALPEHFVAEAEGVSGKNQAMAAPSALPAQTVVEPIPFCFPCVEGELAWVPKEQVLSLPLWEGDKLFLAQLRQETPFFSMKLVYEGDVLCAAWLNGAPLTLQTENEAQDPHVPEPENG